MKEQQIDDINSLQYYYSEFQDLINNSKPRISENLKIYISQEKFIADLDFDIKIESVCGNSTIWVASSINDINRLWRFLEALTLEAPEYCYYVDEEGPDTFLYIQSLNEQKVRVLHITNRIQTNPSIKFDKVKVLQDLIIDKMIFIKTLYDELRRIITNSTEEEADWYNFGDFERLDKDSEIIKEYLNNK